MRPLPAPTYSPEEMIAFARERCPFYRRLYADAPAGARLDQVPVIDQEEFWQAHGRDRQEVLTGPLRDGFVLNSGGTSGQPKFSYITDGEMAAAVQLSARSFEEAGLRDGDRVATLFASGNLYASLLFATKSLEAAQPRVVQFPLGYSPAFAEAAAVIQAFQINVLAGFPTHLLRVIEHLDRDRPDAVRIERIVYAGELFSKEQHGFLQSRFPGVEVRSAGYASVEAGVIGYAEAGCTAGEHRVFDGATLVELLDEQSHETIQEAGQPGRIVFTNLFRRLMPTLRYPTGDRAQWVEPEGTPHRKFLLLGRSEEAARLGTFTVSVSEAEQLLQPSRDVIAIEAFQLLVTQEAHHDQLTIRVAASAPTDQLELVGEAVLRRLYNGRADIALAAQRGVIHPPKVEWIRPDQLIVSAKTGKMLRVVDRRNG